MCDMKKDYVKPHMTAINVEGCDNLMESSYMDIGGTTDRFNVRGHRSRNIWDDLDEEDELAR